MAAGLTPGDVLALVGAGTTGLGAVHELNKDPEPEQRGQSPMGRAGRAAVNTAAGFALPAAATYGLLAAAGPSAAKYPKLSPLLKVILPAAAGVAGGLMLPHAGVRLAALKPLVKRADMMDAMSQTPLNSGGALTAEEVARMQRESMNAPVRNSTTPELAAQQAAALKRKKGPRRTAKPEEPGSKPYEKGKQSPASAYAPATPEPGAKPYAQPPTGAAAAKPTAAPLPTGPGTQGTLFGGGNSATSAHSGELPTFSGVAHPSESTKGPLPTGEGTQGGLPSIPGKPGIVDQLGNFLGKQITEGGLTHGQALGGAALPTINAYQEGGVLPALGGIAGGYGGGALANALMAGSKTLGGLKTPLGFAGSALGSVLGSKLLMPNHPQMQRYASTMAKNYVPGVAGRGVELAEKAKKLDMGLKTYNPSPKTDIADRLAKSKVAFKPDEKGLMVKKSKCAKCHSMHGPGECGMSEKSAYSAHGDFSQVQEGPAGGFMQQPNMLGGFGNTMPNFGSMGSYGDLPPELAAALAQTHPHMMGPGVPAQHAPAHQVPHKPAKHHKKSDKDDEKKESKGKDDNDRDDKDDKKEKESSADMGTFMNSFMDRWNGASFGNKLELFKGGAGLLRKSTHQD
jgi:hypothetical protein